MQKDEFPFLSFLFFFFIGFLFYFPAFIKMPQFEGRSNAGKIEHFPKEKEREMKGGDAAGS